MSLNASQGLRPPSPLCSHPQDYLIIFTGLEKFKVTNVLFPNLVERVLDHVSFSFTFTLSSLVTTQIGTASSPLQKSSRSAQHTKLLHSAQELLLCPDSALSHLTAWPQTSPVSAGGWREATLRQSSCTHAALRPETPCYQQNLWQIKNTNNAT